MELANFLKKKALTSNPSGYIKDYFVQNHVQRLKKLEKIKYQTI